jgi:hypothetical protein
MSQAYGAITRSRHLAFFVNAGSFKDSVMMAFLNNQNREALQFLKALVDQVNMPYFRSQQEKKHLSLLQNVDDMTKQPPAKKKKQVSYELLQMQAMKTSSNEVITSMVYVAKYPNILTNQQAGYYCKGTLTSTESIKVLVKNTHQGHDQQTEIRALEALSGLQGIPTVLGKIIRGEETRLVFEDTGAVPCRTAALNAEQNADLMRIKSEMNNRGWSLHIRDQNVWINAEKVMLFNFEAASCCDLALPQPASEFLDAEDNVDADPDPLRSPTVRFSAQFDAFQPKKPRRATLKQVSALLEQSKAAVNMPSFRCKHHGSADTYGEGTEELVRYMLMKYKQLRDHQLEETQLSFVDLGSGHGGLVDEVAVLMQFGTCFGVELDPKRSSYAQPLADHFFEVVRQHQLRHSKVDIVLGDFLKCSTTKTMLKQAGLVWINNIKFADFNYKILTLLNDTVPIGCVVVSFETLLSRQHNTGFIMISDEVVPDAADWLVSSTQKQKVHVMQKKN